MADRDDGQAQQPRCPGVTSYGHGLTMTIVHLGCCAPPGDRRSRRRDSAPPQAEPEKEAGGMTEIPVRGLSISRPGLAARIAAAIGARQEAVSDRMHSGGDAAARRHGWTITKTTGRFGFGARVYRDPRFADPRFARRS